MSTPNPELLIIISIIFFSFVLAYKSSFLHNKKIGYISLLQIIYLIVFPGLFYTIIFSYVLDILNRPINKEIFFSDKLLTSFLLLSILYTYGGVVIHSFAKTLTPLFAKKDFNSLIFQVNHHFHNQFSHSLIFIGATISATCLALLELNHISPYPEPVRMPIIILTGFFFGLGSILTLIFYKKPNWSELKLFFLIVWIMLIIALYSFKPYLKDAQKYPLPLIIMMTISFLAILSLFLYLKRYKNKLKLVWKIPKRLFD